LNDKTRFREEDISQEWKGISNIKTVLTRTRILARTVTLDKETGSRSWNEDVETPLQEVH
jgi:hypothetical protein